MPKTKVYAVITKYNKKLEHRVVSKKMFVGNTILDEKNRMSYRTYHKLYSIANQNASGCHQEEVILCTNGLLAFNRGFHIYGLPIDFITIEDLEKREPWKKISKDVLDAIKN